MNETLVLIGYFVFVAIGVGGVYVWLKQLGRGTDVPITELAARQCLDEIAPDFTLDDMRGVQNAFLGKDNDQKIAIIRSMGHHVTAHFFEIVELKKVEVFADRLHITFGDFAVPALDLLTDDPEGLATWLTGGQGKMALSR